MTSVREKITNSNLGVVVGAMLIVGSIAFIWYSLKPPSRPDAYSRYYTDDDGQTYFKDSAFKFPPFEHNGKTAVEALIFVNAANHKYVGGMRRYTPDAQKRLQEMYAKTDPQGVLMAMQTAGYMWKGSEIKLLYAEPKHWVSAAGKDRLAIPGPDGNDDDPVFP